MIKIISIILLLTSNAFCQLSNQQGNGNLATPSFVWHMNEATGSTYAYDGIGLAIGTYVSTVFVADCLWGSCRDFNGSSSMINLGNETVTNPRTGDFTLSAWIKTGGKSNYQDVIFRYGGNPCFSLRIGDWNGSSTYKHRASFSIRDSVGNVDTVISTSDVDDNEWHYIVGVRDTTTPLMLFYIDGVLDNTATKDNGDANISSYDTYIGGNGYFDGMIEEAVIMKRAMSASEVWHTYKRQTGGKQ